MIVKCVMKKKEEKKERRERKSFQTWWGSLEGHVGRRQGRRRDIIRGASPAARILYSSYDRIEESPVTYSPGADSFAPRVFLSSRRSTSLFPSTPPLPLSSSPVVLT